MSANYLPCYLSYTFNRRARARVCVCAVTAVQPLDLDNLFLFNDGTYSGLQAYKNSKLANLLFAYELSRQLDGTKVKVNAIDPGT